MLNEFFSWPRSSLNPSTNQPNNNTSSAIMNTTDQDSDGEPLVPQKNAEQKRRNDVTTGMFDDPVSPISLVSVYLVIMLNAGIAIFLLVITYVPLLLDTDGTFSSEKHSWYTALTTIPVSLLTAMTTSQIRTMWLRDIFEGQRKGSELTKGRVRRARTLLGIGEFKDQVKFYRVVLGMLSMVLLNSAILGGITPGTIQIRKQFQLQVNPGLVAEAANCWSNVAQPKFGDIGWSLQNGSFLVMNGGTDPRCPGTTALKLLDQTYVPPGFRYQVNSVSVAKEAIGTPSSATGNHGFGLTFGAASLKQWGTNDFVSSQACVPNLIKNPVKCRRNGEVVPTSHHLNVKTNNCSNQLDFYVDPLTAPASNFAFCMDNYTVGSGAIAIGAVNAYAADLAISMNDEAFISTHNLSSSDTRYSVECTVDMASSIGFREVSYTTSQLGSFEKGTNGSRVQGTGRSCTPISSDNKAAGIYPPPGNSALYIDGEINSTTLTNSRTLATGAVSLQWLLSENAFNDGARPTLKSVINVINHLDPNAKPDYAFENDSQNPLEDARGVTIAAVLGQYWGQYDQEVKVPHQSSLIMSSNWALINAQRLGPGKWWAVVYVVPELFVIGLIVMFLIRHRRVSAIINPV